MVYKYRPPQQMSIAPVDTSNITRGYESMGQSIQQMGGAIQQHQINQLAGQAMMGDPRALMELSQRDPNAAMQIQQKQEQQRQYDEKRQLEIAGMANKLNQDLVMRSAYAPDFESAKANFAQEITTNPYAQKLYNTPEKLQRAIDAYDETDYAIGQKMISAKKGGMASAKTKQYADGTTVFAQPDRDWETIAL